MPLKKDLAASVRSTALSSLVNFPSLLASAVGLVCRLNGRSTARPPVCSCKSAAVAPSSLPSHARPSSALSLGNPLPFFYLFRLGFFWEGRGVGRRVLLASQLVIFFCPSASGRRLSTNWLARLPVRGVGQSPPRWYTIVVFQSYRGHLE